VHNYNRSWKTAQKDFWKIYFLYDFWCAQTCSFPAVLGLSIRNCCQRYVATCGKKIICAHLHSRPINYCSGIFFKSVSYLYEVVRTNFSADFWTFRNFWRQFRKNCGAIWRRKWEPCSAPDSAIPSEKNRWKQLQKWPINRHTILVWTVSPTHRHTKRDVQKKHQFSLLQPARVVQSPQTILYACW